MILLAVLMVDAALGQLSAAQESRLVQCSRPHPLVILGDMCQSAGFINFLGERNQTGDHRRPAQVTVGERELSVATRKTLDSLTRIPWRFGITYDAFAQPVKAVYVEVAEREFTIDHNMTRTPEECPAHLAKVVYDNVPTGCASVFRTQRARMARHLLQELDRGRAEHDRDNKSDMLGSGRTRLGVGIHQIAETWPETRNDED